MGLTGYSLTRANKREKDAERSDEEMRLKSAKRSARVELQRTARNIRDMLETLHAWKRSPLSERKAFYQLLVGLFRQRTHHKAGRPMIYGYIRVSSDKQTVENQRSR